MSAGAMVLRRVCAWCQAVLEEGSPGADVSHSICETCDAKFRKELQAMTDTYIDPRERAAQLSVFRRRFRSGLVVDREDLVEDIVLVLPEGEEGRDTHRLLAFAASRDGTFHGLTTAFEVIHAEPAEIIELSIGKDIWLCKGCRSWNWRTVGCRGKKCDGTRATTGLEWWA